MARVLTEQMLAEIEEACTKVPTRLAALIPALHLVQAKYGHISDDAALDIAEKLDIPPVRVHEVISFYTMFHSEPTGRHNIKICRNLACQLRGADKIIEKAEEVLGIKVGETTKDGRVTLETDECLASCGTGPMLWCSCRPEEGKDGEYQEKIVENLNEDKLEKFLKELP